MRLILTLLCRLVTYFLYRRMEVEHGHRLPADRPVLIVANHLNGLVDPAVLIAALGRSPRFLAKATLRKILGVGWLLQAFGVIFVQRQQDGDGTGANSNAFAACHAALRKCDVVAIFPEGVTHDRPQLAPLKTGAARIALGARASGAEGLLIVPVGMTFDDKVSLRGEALVTFGEPIDLDTLCAPGADDSDPEAVDELTAEIERRLRDVSPDFPDVETWLALDEAAEVVCRTASNPTPSLARQAAIARSLMRSDQTRRDEVVRQVGRYSTVLAGLRIDDRDVAAPITLAGLARRAVWTGLLVVVLGSIVGATILVNVVPLMLVLLSSLFVERPVLKGTVRGLLGLVLFPAAWFTAGSLSADGPLAVTAIAAFFLLGAVAGVLLLDRTTRFVGAVLRWRLVRERRATLADACEIRADVVRSVEQALASRASAR